MVAVVAVLAEIGLFTWLLHTDSVHRRALWLVATSTVVFVVAMLALRRVNLAPRHLAIVIVGVGAVLQLIALTHAPRTSDDDYRYLWDAKVQLSGTDPYRYAPAAPELSSLRAAPIFGADGPCRYRIPGTCTAINRPTVHTIYPPVAEAAFVAVRVLSFGGHGGHLPLQIVAALGCCLISVLLVRRALRRGDPVWTAAIWAWCPLVVNEFGNNAHIDWLAVLLVVWGLGAYSAGRLRGAGLLIGAAIATKLYPGVLLASLLRRRPWLVLGTSLGFVALTYVPHVAAVGSKVIGYLPGYLHEEGYSSGDHLLLLGAVFPHPLDTIIGVLVVGAAGVWALARTDPLAPEQTAVVVLGIALLVATPRYGWYAALLVALIVLSRRFEWLPVALAPSFAYADPGAIVDRTIYAIGAALTVLMFAIRYPDSLRACLRFASTSTARLQLSHSTRRR